MKYFTIFSFRFAKILIWSTFRFRHQLPLAFSAELIIFLKQRKMYMKFQ